MSGLMLAPLAMCILDSANDSAKRSAPNSLFWVVLGHRFGWF